MASRPNSGTPRAAPTRPGRVAPANPGLRQQGPGWPAGGGVGITAGILVATPGVSQAAGPLPCDIYGSGGTPCVAAHSTTRALFAAYNGPLYQVRRASNNQTLNIGVLAAGGYA